MFKKETNNIKNKSNFLNNMLLLYISIEKVVNDKKIISDNEKSQRKNLHGKKTKITVIMLRYIPLFIRLDNVRD